MGAMDATDADIATAYSMPVFMIADTTEQMKNITKTGKEQKKADDDAKISFILDMVSIVLMIIPFAGEAAEAIGGVTNVACAALVMGKLVTRLFLSTILSRTHSRLLSLYLV